MIKVTRPSKPPILQRKEYNWTQELCQERQVYYQDLSQFIQGNLSKSPVHPEAKKSRYAHQQIKTRLMTMFGRKCAYCESHITAVSYPHVEHFRPQSIYPRLAYNWDNLLLSCQVCNSGYKGDQFPLRNGVQPLEDDNNPCSLDDTDANALINPCIDDPEEFFDFMDQYLVCLNDRAKRTRDICGLDRDDLNDARWLVLEPIETIAKIFIVADKNGRFAEKKELADILKKYIASSSPYSAMIRSKLRAMGIYTDIVQST